MLIEKLVQLGRYLLLILCTGALLRAAPSDAAEWYKGSLHTHSIWTDGQELPELAAYWYKNAGYNFFVLTDHNTIAEGDYYTAPISSISWLSGSLSRATSLFGPDWNVIVDNRVKLKTFDEIKQKLDSSDFLMIRGEEVTTSTYVDGVKYDVHVNAIHTPQYIAPFNGPTTGGVSVAECLQKNVAAVNAIPGALSQVNHPNWGSVRPYGVSPEDVAASGAALLEVYNGGSDTHTTGGTWNGRFYPSTATIWDVANTIRLAAGLAPLYGTATDDAHHYQSISTGSFNPGRGYVMVRASELSTDAIVDAMRRGDFYASTGVTLSQLEYDPATSSLTIAVEEEAGINYRIDFIGTLIDADPTPNPDGTYSKSIGKVLASVNGTSATYTFTGTELFVRAMIYSDKRMDNPSSSNGITTEVAWTQPISPQLLTTPEPSAKASAAIGLFVLAGYLWHSRFK